jgi:integrase/recombinase XerD
MFELLFKYPGVVARHREEALAEARERFLQHCADQGMSEETLARFARQLLLIVRQIDVSPREPITSQQIAAAADCLARQRRRGCRSGGRKQSREVFIHVATTWLRYLGYLKAPEQEHPAHRKFIEEFAAYMREERGLSPSNIRTSCWHIAKFLDWLKAKDRSLAQVAIQDVDAFLASQGNHGWSRVTLAGCTWALRPFFRYGEQRSWCAAGIAEGITGPRLFRYAGLPVGPDWSDVQRLLESVAASKEPSDIRDAAILKLFAIYGFRSGEVARLRLEDVSWANDRIYLLRPKQRRREEYPLLPSVGEAILRYVQWVRPRSSQWREIFLTVQTPFRPLSAGALYSRVSGHLDRLGIRSLKRGPHALRHACAGHLVAEGLTLKEIGDHLGHRSANATRIYA